jgi:sialidase-1
MDGPPGERAKTIVCGYPRVTIRKAGVIMRTAAVTMLLTLCAPGAALGQDDRPVKPLDEQDLFVAGADGYDTYRIPALAVTTKGTLLALCEGRKNSRSDTGDIDLVLKRSRDGGQNWLPMQTAWDAGPHTAGNPCVVVDQKNGRIWLLATHNLAEDDLRPILNGTSKGTRTCWVMHSGDDGETWSRPTDITRDTKRPDWTWYATGPGCGIQLRTRRLVIPCDHALAGSGMFRSHVFYSDDHGRSWRVGGTVGDHVNECQVVERADGSLLLNMRNYARGENGHRRAIATSTDGGKTWSELRYDPQLVEPVCQASLIRYTARPVYERNRLLFANPASTKREKMTVRLSYDEGETWAVTRELFKGPSAYSALAVLPDGRAACFYECGENHPYERIRLARFALDWLTDGKDRLRPGNQTVKERPEPKQ